MTNRLKRVVAKAAIIAVTGLAVLAAGALVVTAATTIGQTAKKKKKKKKRGKPVPSFIANVKISGQLSPGRTLPIALTVANNRKGRQWITSLTIHASIDAQHATAGCSATRDFRVGQIPSRVFPYMMRATRYRKKKKGRKAKPITKPMRSKYMNGRPTITMVNLATVNQNACQGATVTLKATGRSVTRKPRMKKHKKKSTRQKR